MQRFRVWGPRARQVEVEIGGKRHDLTAIGGGWWQAIIDSAGPGADYAYILDGQLPAVPDPRSERQPYGVHGPSRVVDQTDFAWSDEGWRAPAFASGIVYELHVGTFTPEGTFDAAIEHFGHLKDLGITHVELLPVAAFPGVQGWGYDGVDLFAVHESYGGPDGLKRLVNAAHGKGLAVFLDVVYNHLGPSGSYVDKFGPYFTASHVTPWGDAVNLEDAGSHEVRRFFCDNALMWLRDYHFDGLRLDAVHARRRQLDPAEPPRSRHWFSRDELSSRRGACAHKRRSSCCHDQDSRDRRLPAAARRMVHLSLSNRLPYLCHRLA